MFMFRNTPPGEIYCYDSTTNEKRVVCLRVAGEYIHLLRGLLLKRPQTASLECVPTIKKSFAAARYVCIHLATVDGPALRTNPTK